MPRAQLRSPSFTIPSSLPSIMQKEPIVLPGSRCPQIETMTQPKIFRSVMKNETSARDRWLKMWRWKVAIFFTCSLKNILLSNVMRCYWKLKWLLLFYFVIFFLGVSNGLCEHLWACEYSVFLCEHEHWQKIALRATSTFQKPTFTKNRACEHL